MEQHLGLPHWAVVVLEGQERIEHALAVQANGHHAIKNRLEAIMGAIYYLNAKTAALQAAVGALGDDLGAALDRVQVDVDFLKAQIAAGQPDLSMAMAALDASLTSIGVVSERLRAVDPDPMNPPPAA